MKMQSTKRSAEEILARIRQVKDQDWMGTQTADLMFWLPFELAREFLRQEMTEEKFKEIAAGNKPPLEQALEYLPFAWGKANNCRGLSAGRSLDHLSAWLWLAGYGELVDAEFSGYSHYGKSQLVMASTICDFDWRAHDDGEWVAGEDRPSLSANVIQAMAEEAEEKGRAALAGQHSGA